MTRSGLISVNINNSLAWAHPIVQEWFLEKFGSATEPQKQGWPLIRSGCNTLIGVLIPIPML